MFYHGFFSFLFFFNHVYITSLKYSRCNVCYVWKNRRTFFFFLFQSQFFFLFLFLGSCQSCQDTAWEKVSGARPEYTISKVALFSGEDAHGIVIPCFERYNISFFINFHMILYLIVKFDSGVNELIALPSWSTSKEVSAIVSKLKVTSLFQNQTLYFIKKFV